LNPSLLRAGDIIVHDHAEVVQVVLRPLILIDIGISHPNHRPSRNFHLGRHWRSALNSFSSGTILGDWVYPVPAVNKEAYAVTPSRPRRVKS